MKLVGRVGTDDREGRFNVEADLTNTKIDESAAGLGQAAGQAGARWRSPWSSRKPERCGSTIC